MGQMRNWGVQVARYGCALAILVSLGALRASADSITFDISSVNFTGFTGPFIQVTVDRTSATTAVITFSSLTSTGVGCSPSPCTFMMGGSSAADLNVNASAFSVSTPTESNSLGGSFTPTLVTHPHANSWLGHGTVDGFGTFNLTINNHAGFTDSATSFGFTLTNTSGTWSSASDVLVANSLGHSAGAHVFIACGASTNCGGGFGTGSATTPELGTLMSLGTGLLILGQVALMRRKRSRQQNTVV